MSTAFQSAGAQGKPTKYAALWSDTFFTGLWTNRNPLRDAATPFIYRKFYGATRYESLWDGLNVEMSSHLTLIRRPGLIVYNDQTFGPISRFYEFHNFAAGNETIKLIADTPTSDGGVIYDATGPHTQTAIYTKSPGAGNAYFQSIGNILYFGDDMDQVKYLEGGAGWVAQNWGVSIAGTQVTHVPVTGTNGGGAGNIWVNPGNVSSSINYATSSTTATVPTQSLRATNFAFGWSPTDKITGINVTVYSGSTNPCVVQVRLLYNGFPIGDTKSTIVVPGPSSYSFGNFTDLWGIDPLNPGVVNSSSFGVQFTFVTGPGSQEIRSVFMTIYGSRAPVATPSGVGTFSATSGYQYVYSYGNSLNGGLSTASPPSNNTGIFTTVNYVVLSGILPSLDTQVNQLHVFRTKDGGSTFFELPNSPYPAGTTTLNDNAPDSQLSLFSQAPLSGYNDPPPAGFNRPTYHVGRMWGAVENFVYYSRTPDQAVPGVAVESFPPSNYFEFPSSIVRLIPTVYGLLVFTGYQIWVIQGTGDTNSLFSPVPFVPLYGLASYDALTQNGSLLYLYTSDRQLVSLDPNAGLSESGFPIGDKLEVGFDPLLANVTYHPGGSSDKAVYITDGSTQWYRLSPVATPEQGQMFSTVAQITGGFSAVQSVEVNGGQHALLVAPPVSGPILMRHTGVVTDNGTTYPAYATIGSIVLAQPGQLAEMSFIAADYKGFAAGGTAPTISVLLDDTQGAFSTLPQLVNEPPTLPASLYTVGSRWYFSPATEPGGQPLPAWCRHLQIKMSWPATSTHDEIYSYTIFGAQQAEK